jgi:hypothetical protein
MQNVKMAPKIIASHPQNPAFVHLTPPRMHLTEFAIVTLKNQFYTLTINATTKAIPNVINLMLST